MYFLKSPRKLSPTEKLFHDDAYATETDAEVLYVQDDLVVLDRTLFYAESGGQIPDRGFIDDVEVIDVQKNPGRPIYIRPDENPYGIEVPQVQIDTVIVHRCATAPPFVSGQRVHLKLDWASRYQAMRQHSASHFVYLAVREIYGRTGPAPETKGCHISATRSRFDFHGKLDPAGVSEVAALANEWIGRGDAIVMEPDRRTREVSYWLSGNLIVPCGGTHVRHASELGPLRVKRESQGRSLDRIYANFAENG